VRGRGTNVAWDYAERRRRERNYRWMFKCALLFCAFGIVVTILGGAEALIAGRGYLLSFGLMLAALSASSAWLSVDSTVRIIELDINEPREQG
jgi:hypothetical protein